MEVQWLGTGILEAMYYLFRLNRGLTGLKYSSDRLNDSMAFARKSCSLRELDFERNTGVREVRWRGMGILEAVHLAIPIPV